MPRRSRFRRYLSRTSRSVAAGSTFLRYRVYKAFGYAHADVSRVVLRLPSGQQVSTSTFAAGWPGSEVRLWAVSIPSDTWQDGQAKPTITATGYDAAGRVVGQVQLGRPG